MDYHVQRSHVATADFFRVVVVVFCIRVPDEGTLKDKDFG